MVWILYRWTKKRNAWIWREELPLLVCISILVAPYAWLSDQVLLLLPAAQVTVMQLQQGKSQKRWALAAIYLLINAIAFLLLTRFRIFQIVFVWMPYAFLGLFLWARKRPSPDSPLVEDPSHSYTV
jgi:hypothetical protein